MWRSSQCPGIPIPAKPSCSCWLPGPWNGWPASGPSLRLLLDEPPDLTLTIAGLDHQEINPAGKRTGIQLIGGCSALLRIDPRHLIDAGRTIDAYRELR